MDIDFIKSPEELLEYMDKNITYGFVGKNGKKYYDMFSEEWNDWYDECIVQDGNELLESKVGTCWDQVELERMWFEKNKYSFKTIFIAFNVNRDNNLPTHTFLLYESNGKYYWFEHSFEAYKGIHEFNSEIEAIEFVKEKQYEFALNNDFDIRDGDKERLTVYVYSKPKKDLGVSEYFEHVTAHLYK